MRLFGIVATERRVVAVFRRGPERWWWLSRWDLDREVVEPGAWFHGTLYPRRCDLSPDGELLSYVASKASRGFLGRDGHEGTYSAISKLPWLFALAAWAEADRSALGYHFVTDPEVWAPGAPGHGDVAGLRGRLGLARTVAEQYAVERRRGWSEHKLSPPRAPDDIWDEKRSAVLTRARPGGGARLTLSDRIHRVGIEDRAPDYRLNDRALPDVVWADWDARGRLLVATADHRLQVRRCDTLHVIEEHDLARAEPKPREAPPAAQTW